MEERRKPSFKSSVLVIGTSLIIMIIGVAILKLSAEILLSILAMFVAVAAMKLGYTWEELEDAISDRMRGTIPTLLIIWIIGMVIGAFIYAGSIPMMIYFGLKWVSPQWVLLSAFITCIIFSTVTGSSWSSAGTAGVAFMGVAAGLGVPLHIAAGAVISGSIFGDKLSPLSETTNLAPLCAGANLYDHIKSMLWTTLPPTIIAGIVYTIIGRNYGVGVTEMPETTVAMMNSLDGMFKWGILPLIPFVIILVGALTKRPPVPSLFISVVSALIIGSVYQGFPLAEGFRAALNGFNTSMVYQGEVPDAVLSLLNRGGMKSMVSVVTIVFCGYAFASMISKAGFLETALEPITSKIKNSTQLILSTLATVLLIFLSTGNAYVAFILVGEMYRDKYAEIGVAPMVLSRSLEDVGTTLGSLIPWSSSAVFYVSTLGVSMFGSQGYAPWAFISYLSPIFAIIWAVTGRGIYRTTSPKEEI